MNNGDMIDLERLVLILRRHIPLMGLVILLFLLPACLYLLFTPPEYTAKTLVLLDRRATATVADVSSLKEMGFEDSAIESEVEVIRSRRVIDEVINSLIAKGYFKDIYKEDGERDNITQKLQASTLVGRIGETYVLSIEHTSRDPVQAADTANAFAEAYIREQLSALSETSIRTTAWLASKLEELRAQTTDAQKAVSEFRAKYNIKAQRQLTERETPEERGASVQNGVGLSELRGLEKKAETYGDLYNSYVEKLGTISMQQALPMTETRIITRAMVPENKSHPKTTIILGIALIIGSGLGVLIAIIRDNADRTLKRGGQIKNEIGAPFLGFLPKLKSKNKTSLKLFSNKGTSHDVSMSTESIDDPVGAYSVIIRTLINTADQAIGTERKKVIGIISADSGKGKSIVASNLAVFAAQSSTCLLIDADIRSSEKFYGGLADGSDKGLENILIKNTSLDDTILVHKADGLSFLPRSGRDVNNALLHLNAAKVKGLVESCKKHYDIIIVDCPPLSEPSEVYGFAQAVDCFIIIAEWGKTLSNSLNFHLRQNGIPAEKILGVVLENTDTAKMVKHYGYKVPA